MKKLSCLNPECPLHSKIGAGSIIRHGFYRTTAGKRRRYRCVECGQTFSSTKGTPYYRLQHRRVMFDTVVALRVEGVSISAIARVEGLAWNTVASWLDRAAHVCRRFNHDRTAGVVVEELQVDEIRSFTGGKTRPTWIFAAIDVGSRLWPSTVVGATQLPEYVGARSRRRDADGLRDLALDRHGRIRVLRDGRPACLRPRRSLRAGDQDPSPRSRRAGRTKSADGSRLAIRRRAPALPRTPRP